MTQNQVVLRDNDHALIEILLQEVRKINPQVLVNVVFFPSTVRIQIQSEETFRSRIFNKLHHLHRIYGLTFSPTSFIKRDKSLISFDLKWSIDHSK